MHAVGKPPKALKPVLRFSMRNKTFCNLPSNVKVLDTDFEMVIMNTQLVESLVQVIRSLGSDERQLLEEKLFWEPSEPSTQELMQLAQRGGAFEFLHDEPDLYSLTDGEPI
jgi:hypothetical protein